MKKVAIAIELIDRASSARVALFKIRGSFALESSRSKAASNRIKIRPTVPRSSRIRS